MPRLSKIGAAALAAFGWTSGVSAVTASYLQVAGGGGGGTGQTSSSIGGGGGGGAGGYLTGTTSLNPTLSYTVIVGAGGVGGIANTRNSVIGNNSQFGVLTSSVGGGSGGNYDGVAAGTGGSGGGGAYNATSGAAGTAGQGNAGGNAYQPGAYYGSGGGGGAGAVGGSAASNTVAPGGIGLTNSITGTSTYYAGGGGGGSGQTAGGSAAGGLGGGGAGGFGTTAGIAGTANLGGGGGGGGNIGTGGTPSSNGGNGGSGVVIISYTSPQKFSGGIVTSSGGNTIHTFTTSGTLGPITTLSASYLIVAGGGAGGGVANEGGSGGGGGGGLQAGSGITIDPNSTYLVTVGAGGAVTTDRTVRASNGGNSSFSAFATASVGGGSGGNRYDIGGVNNGAVGGSGGGGGPGQASSAGNGSGGAGTSGQGNAGGNPYYNNGADRKGGGGGGGAGAIGQAGNSSTLTPGNGGAGLASSISGTSTLYAGGGGGGGDANGNFGTGGSGGGGAGGSNNSAAGAGTANLGGGGGGSGNSFTGTPANGGSGIVIISYAGSTQQMAGGTVTIVGGNVIHTFTSTGYLAPIKFSTGSLRFRRTNSAYLTRTPTSAGNRQKFTISMWVKRGELTNRQGIIAAGTSTGGSGPGGSIYFDNSSNGNTISLIGAGGTSYVIQTTQTFRDPAAWYHLVFAWDTTQATNTNRMIMYVNGLPVTSFASATYPSQNFSTDYNNTAIQAIGARTDDGTSTFLDGEVTEAYMIDGQQLTPSSFGTFNSFGVWQPITYGGSYGTNGFYLPFNRQAVSFAGSFNGSSQYLTVPSNSIYNQTGDFTIEYYAYFAANTNYQEVVARGTSFITIQHSSDANAMVRLVAYGTATIATGGNVVAQKWNHFAIVRSGSTVTGYVNGVAVCSGTYANSITDTIPLSIGANGYGGSFTHYTNGYVSNVRYNNNAVYTSNFTPSTAPLTSSANTLLLTLQNSSIVDNSSTGASITNVGGVSTGQTYPFAWGIFNDQSPAGNNWTPANISGVFGSTLDYLGDAPTLTSSTVANYCVLNPIDTNASPAITNGNLNLASTGATWKTARSTISLPLSVGKFYMELSVTANSNDCEVGFCSQSQTLAEPFTMSTCVAYTFGAGNKYVNGSASAYGASVAIGDIVGVAYDTDAGTITFYKNGTSQGAITTGWSAGFYSFVYSLYGRSGGTTSGWVNFGQQPFVYTPPSGFVALNTLNL